MASEHDKNRPVTRLVDAVREVKMANAERNDVVIELKEADRARLEILAAELQPVFEDVPLDDERFDFAISSGLQPRLWIDATAHVMMGKDRRNYRFVRDTRLGRIVLAEGHKTAPIAEAVTRYIAERLIEREMAFAGDDLSLKGGVPHMRETPVAEAEAEQPAVERHQPAKSLLMHGQDVPSPPRTTPDAAAELPSATKRSVTSASWIGWLLLGLFIGGGGLLLAFRDQLLP